MNREVSLGEMRGWTARWAVALLLVSVVFAVAYGLAALRWPLEHAGTLLAQYAAASLVCCLALYTVCRGRTRFAYAAFGLLLLGGLATVLLGHSSILTLGTFVLASLSCIMQAGTMSAPERASFPPESVPPREPTSLSRKHLMVMGWGIVFVMALVTFIPVVYIIRNRHLINPPALLPFSLDTDKLYLMASLPAYIITLFVSMAVSRLVRLESALKTFARAGQAAANDGKS